MAKDQGHSHDHGPTSGGRFFAAVALNSIYVVVELVAGVFAGSVALIGDAIHNLGDVIGLVVAWAGGRLSEVSPSPAFSYGLKRSSILAALINAILLLVTIGGLSWEAIGRLNTGSEVNAPLMIWIPLIGVVINGGTALLFLRGKDKDINERGAYLHMVADALVSVGVVLSGILIWKTGWHWVDPVVSLVISVVILKGAWGILRAASRMILDGVPLSIEIRQVEEFLKTKPGVSEVHDIHIWNLGTTTIALTAHLVMPNGHPGDAFLRAIEKELHDRFGVEHTTLQIDVEIIPGCMPCNDYTAQGNV